MHKITQVWAENQFTLSPSRAQLQSGLSSIQHKVRASRAEDIHYCKVSIPVGTGQTSESCTELRWFLLIEGFLKYFSTNIPFAPPSSPSSQIHKSWLEEGSIQSACPPLIILVHAVSSGQIINVCPWCSLSQSV